MSTRTQPHCSKNRILKYILFRNFIFLKVFLAKNQNKSLFAVVSARKPFNALNFLGIFWLCYVVTLLRVWQKKVPISKDGRVADGLLERMFKGERGRLVFFVSSWILLAYAWRGFGDNPVGFGWILSTGQAFRLRCRRVPVWMAGVLPPAECGKVNHQQSPDQKPLMPGLHTRALPCHEKSAEQRVSGGVSDSAMAQSRISRVLRGAAERERVAGFLRVGETAGRGRQDSARRFPETAKA